MSHRSTSASDAAPLRAPSTAEVLVVARSHGVSAATTSTSSRTEKGMRARRRSRYSREPCAERRKQPTLKNAERKDMTMRTKPYLQRNSRTFRTLERRQGL
jgi:hypothetical protein